MIIKCEKCQTKFRLDDSRVTDKGVKVRCAKCKHVFRVRREEPEEELFESGGTLTGFSAPQDETPSAIPEDQSFTAEFAQEPSADTVAFEDEAPSDQSPDFSSFESSSFDASAISFESDELDITGTESGTEVAAEPADKREVDFSGFDFGDSETGIDSTQSSVMEVDDFTDRSTEPVAEPQKAAPQGLDFSDDDMFGAVVQAAPDVSNAAIAFDFGDDSFAESMDMSGKDSGGKSGTLFSLNAPGDAPFSLGEIDFGDELTSVAVQQVNPDDLKPSQEILFAPLAEAQDTSADDELKRSFLGEDSIGAQEELPPLSIASRRKKSPLFGGVIALVTLVVISVLGYIGYSSFSPSNETTVSTDTGKIAVQDVQAAFIENDEAGELLVISGEALNEYPNSRAALQVKVTVFDAKGQSVATKTAYGGNPLTDEQLEGLPLSKIEAAMTNQFGDSLANMEVAPGKTIPFVVVLANLPKGAKDFGVQAVGSTVATGKQQ